MGNGNRLQAKDLLPDPDELSRGMEAAYSNWQYSLNSNDPDAYALAKQYSSGKLTVGDMWEILMEKYR